MKIIVVCTLLWGNFIGNALHQDALVIKPEPVAIASTDPVKPAKQVVRNYGTVWDYNSNRGIGTIQDQEGRKYRVSARNVNKRIKTGDRVSFEEETRMHVRHAVSVEPN